MTVSAQNSYIVYTGNGSTTAYSWPYKLFTASDLKVYTVVIATGVETLQTSGGGGTYDYTINAGLDTVTLTTNLPVTHKLFLTRIQSIEQPTDYIEGDAFPAATHEDTLDKIVLQLQQHEEQLKRALKFKQSTATRSEPAIPELAADKLIKVNSAGTGFETQSTVDVTAVAAISADITTVAGISSDVTAVAADASDIGAVAADASDIGAVAAKATEIGRLGTSAAVADLALLGTSAVVADLAFLGTADVVADMNTLASADFVSDLNTLATSGIVTDMDLLATSANVTAMGLLGVSGVITNMGLLGTSAVVTDMGLLGTSAVITDLDLLATSAVLTDMDLLATSANVTAMGVLGTSANVTAMATVSTNIAGVNSFADRYRVQAGVPSTSLDIGDLNFDTTADELKVYKSSGWAAAGSTVNGTSQRYTYNISGTPTTVTGADAKGDTLAYDAGFVDVFLNGTRLSNSSGSYTGDVTVTSGTTVTFLSALTNGDVVDVVAYGTFNVAAVAGSAITSGTISSARMPVTIAATWESKSANFVAAAGKAYFCDTSGGAIDVTLPSPTIGDTIRFLDVAATFDTNDLTILNGSSKIQGASANLDVATERAGFELVYYNTAQGWLLKDK